MVEARKGEEGRGRGEGGGKEWRVEVEEGRGIKLECLYRVECYIIQQC